MQRDSEALNLGQVLGVLRRRLPLIGLCVVVVVAAAFGFSKQQTKEYTATAAIAFSNDPLSQQVAGLPPVSVNPLTQQASNVELVRLGDMSFKTAQKLGGGLTPEAVATTLSISAQGESNVVGVSATATSPALAARIANTYTHQFAREQQGSNRQYFKSALALVDRQLEELPPEQRFSPAAVALQNRAQTLRLLEGLDYDNVKVAQVASIPTSPSSPKTMKNTIVGALLGLLLGLGLAFVLERLHRDRHIDDLAELEEAFRLPLVGTVPESTALARATGPAASSRALSPAEAEAFRLIRARLRFFNADRDLRTIMVTSAARGEGKTTTARRLAEAAAAAGSLVLLIEADFREPTLAKQLDLQAGPGLADVLIGTIPIEEAIQSVALDTQAQNGGASRRLDVLACGSILPPNPSELIESHAMSAVLERARARYGLIVIDTPPLTAVSDAFPLLRKVDGVLVVSWIGHGRRDLTERLRQTLERSGAPTLGVVANRVRSGIADGYGGAAQNAAAPPPSPAGHPVAVERPVVPTIDA
jgi:capsular exopolysaccharide synthesis family protein